MKDLKCPFCGAPAKNKKIDLGPNRLVSDMGLVSFGWEDNIEKAFIDDVTYYSCTSNPTHYFFIPGWFKLVK